MKTLLSSFFSLETLIRLVGITLGTVFSPTWPLLHLLLDPYLNLTALLSNGLSLQTIFMMDAQVHAIPVSTITTYLIPGLLGCLVVNIGFIYLCGRFGVLLSRQFAKRFQPAA
jgi:hypothetical protein